MRTIRTAALLAATALLALAATAPAASATGDPVLLKNMSGGAPGVACPAVTKTGGTVTGGCVIQWRSSIARIEYGTRFGPYETVDGDCTETLTARVDGAGHGWITNVALTDTGCGDFTLPCAQPWEIQFHKTGSGAFHGHFQRCIQIVWTYSGLLDLNVSSDVFTMSSQDGRLLPGTIDPNYGWVGETTEGTWHKTVATKFSLS
jgi:hypothetical protein